MTASIHDVAKRAGVSISTVSRILNNSAAVSDKKAAAVREAMEYYQYEPNQFGRGLVKQTSHMIGVYIPYSSSSVFDSSYNLELLKGMEQILSHQDYSLVLISEQEAYENVSQSKPRFLDYIRQKRVDGLLLSGLSSKSMAEGAFKQLLDEGYPMVYIGKRFHANGFNVYAQYELYMYHMVETLYQSGHRKIALYMIKNHESSLKHISDRVTADLKDMEVIPVLLTDSQVVSRTYIVSSIREHVIQQECTAVCSPSMEFTRSMLSAFGELKLSVPEDVSLISVEHKKEDGQVAIPPVSAFYVPARDMGVGAANLLLSSIHEEEMEDKSQEYETIYIERESIRHL